MRRITFITMIVAIFLTTIPMQKAQAFDPVTIAILAPIALQVAEAAMPYIQKGLISGGSQLLTMGSDLLEVFLLPVGFVQSTLLAPWQFSSGLKNIFVGVIAPFKLAFHALLLPLAFLGLSVN